ncbi:hypothetical protein JAAARDRAFT_51098 [Jaapia argillacea MUCL 33604]|uniref:Uncharacterized protein n=1 Tax=Jaapia argillacea MUCL 33604 TaxID=933084 RepID=A0A067PAF0_9AGAM|nr:hypothetical protein JAAARDRAFT_51098 [Jaapia argillacea MUCL 33604]
MGGGWGNTESNLAPSTSEIGWAAAEAAESQATEASSVLTPTATVSSLSNLTITSSSEPGSNTTSLIDTTSSAECRCIEGEIATGACDRLAHLPPPRGTRSFGGGIRYNFIATTAAIASSVLARQSGSGATTTPGTNDPPSPSRPIAPTSTTSNVDMLMEEPISYGSDNEDDDANITLSPKAIEMGQQGAAMTAMITAAGVLPSSHEECKGREVHPRINDDEVSH